MLLRTARVTVTAATIAALGAPTVPAFAEQAPARYTPASTTCNPRNHVTDKVFNINKSFDFSKNVTVNKNFDFSKNVTINKNFDFSKNIVVNRNVNIEKNFDLSRNINIEKNIDLSKTINVEKNIDLSKTIIINKEINIDKGRDSGNAEAIAAAYASAAAFANANANAFAFARSSGGTHITVVNQGGGDLGALAVETPCVVQWGVLVRAVHAVCIDKTGFEHPAVRMRKETWIDSPTSSEIYRCLEGSTLKAIVGDVVESDRGMAGVYERGEVLTCLPGEALRHFKDGLVKCAPAEKVRDCVERENLRAFGVGDVFFSYQAEVCVRSASFATGGYSVATGEVQLSGPGFTGGVGQ